MTFFIKENDTAPAYVAALKDNFDTSPIALDLTNATSVTFKMRQTGQTGSPKVSGTMVMGIPKTGGTVTYNWGTADTDTPGVFDVEFEILWNDGRKETVPNGADPAAQYMTIEVVDDLDP